MFAQVWSSALHGVNALPVSVEAHLARGLSRFFVVGLPDSAVRESSYRVKAAIKTSGFRFPSGTVTVNLAPADLPKEGSAFDLPIALGILAAHEQGIPDGLLTEFLIVGEVSLDGALRPVRGVLSMSVCARRAGKRGILVPVKNAREASVVEGIDVYPIRTVMEAYEFLSGDRSISPVGIDRAELFRSRSNYTADFSEVRGQNSVKRALEVAATGGHNLLMVGPPGSGKTMLARRVPSLLPSVSLEEAIETTKIHSVGGALGEDEGLVATRPFRAPHHTISDVGLCGGGSNPSPGEISLAHNGVLFMDELPEFKRSVLEVLRQPLEERAITISRARTTVTYPASFMLIASMNPCPCGYRNDPERECACIPQQIQRYLARISGPLLDRIDIHIEVLPVPFDKLSASASAEPSSRIRRRVEAGRAVQAARFHAVANTYNNAQMPPDLVKRHCNLDQAGNQLVRTAIERLGLSARAYNRILKVARSIADLAGSGRIQSSHVAEAIQYRSLDRDRWNE